jgi:hypothetical protein
VFAVRTSLTWIGRPFPYSLYISGRDCSPLPDFNGVTPALANRVASYTVPATREKLRSLDVWIFLTNAVPRDPKRGVRYHPHADTTRFESASVRLHEFTPGPIFINNQRGIVHAWVRIVSLFSSFPRAYISFHVPQEPHQSFREHLVRAAKPL